MPFDFIRLDVPGLVVVEPKAFKDERGMFTEIYKHADFVKAGIPEHFVQDNFSRSSKGVLRGMHYQTHPKAQGKLVRCMKGRIYDVAVDLRHGSPSHGRWTAIELTEENGLMLYVPVGFAHGFLVLSDTAEVLYKCTGEYSPEHDRGIIWNDPDIAIDWLGIEPKLSPKDRVLPSFRDAADDFRYAP